MIFPLALRTFQVPCPIQVKLTSAFSAMRTSLAQARPEKAIFPHAQDEDADRRDRPEVGEDEIARGGVEAEQEYRQHGERAEPTALDAAHDEQENERQQGQPLVRPD